MQKEKIKAVIYARLSDEDVNKLDSDAFSKSINNQIELGVDFIKSQGWTLYDKYIDDDYSGGDVHIERPDFQRMISDARDRKYHVIVCKTQSRFSRNMEEIERYLHNKFEEWNIRFIGIVDHVDTAIKGTKKSRQINGLANEWFLEDLSENIRGTLKKLKSKGLYTGSSFPYGYKKEPKDHNKLIIDEPAASIVREIFDMFITGDSYYKIANTLNQRGVLTPWQYKKDIYGVELKIKSSYTQRIWTRDIIRTMVKNEVYIGDLIQGKSHTTSYKNSKKKQVPKDEWIRVEDTHEAIISKDKWEIVQKRLASRARTEKSSGTINIFSMKVYCKECGNIFHKCKSHGYEYMRCKTLNMDRSYCDNINRVSIKKLEDFVLNELNKLISTYKNDVMLKEKIELENPLKRIAEELKKEISEAESKLNKMKGYFKKLYVDKLNDIISEDEFLLLKYEFEKEINMLNIGINNKKSEYDKALEKSLEVMDKDKIISKYENIEKLTREIIDTFIDSIYISKKNPDTNEREIVINWLI